MSKFTDHAKKKKIYCLLLRRHYDTTTLGIKSNSGDTFIDYIEHRLIHRPYWWIHTDLRPISSRDSPCRPTADSWPLAMYLHGWHARGIRINCTAEPEPRRGVTRAPTYRQPSPTGHTRRLPPQQGASHIKQPSSDGATAGLISGTGNASATATPGNASDGQGHSGGAGGVCPQQLDSQVADMQRQSPGVPFDGSQLLDPPPESYSDFVNHFRNASPYIAGHSGRTFVLVIPSEVKSKFTWPFLLCLLAQASGLELT